MPAHPRPTLDGYVAIADAMSTLVIGRQDLLRRVRAMEIETMVYVPARGGWFLPSEVVDRVAAEDRACSRPSA